MLPRTATYWLVFAALITSVCCTGASAGENGRLRGFDEVVVKAMATWEVPGAAVAVVKDGKVIYAKGFGYRDKERKLPVTTGTLFAIGSDTKSFTSLLFGILNDEGKVSWDKPIRTYLPTFQLADPIASEHATALDLFSHRTGLPSLDVVWYTSNFSREDLVNRLRYLKPNKEFRSRFEYCNLMVMTMGYLEGHVAGSSWEELVRTRIFQPLGMAHANFSVTDTQKAPDFAQPYGLRHDAVVRLPFKNIDVIGPAGSINSNIEEMTHYLVFQLGDGTYEGKKIVSPENLALTHKGLTVVEGLADPLPGVGPPAAYGLGWGELAYRGHRMVTHSGGIDGFRSLVTMLPQDKLGVVVLTNLENNLAANAIAYSAYDRLLNLSHDPWDERYRQIRQKGKAQELEAKKKVVPAGKPDTPPSHPLAAFVGEYVHPGYGTVTISQQGEELQLKLNEVGPVAWSRVSYDSFHVPADLDSVLADLRGQFYLNRAGEIDRLALGLEATLPEDIVFTRVCAPPAKCSSDPTQHN